MAPLVPSPVAPPAAAGAPGGDQSRKRAREEVETAALDLDDRAALKHFFRSKPADKGGKSLARRR